MCVNYANGGRRISHLKLTARRVNCWTAGGGSKKRLITGVGGESGGEEGESLLELLLLLLLLLLLPLLAEGEIYAPKLISCKNN